VTRAKLGIGALLLVAIAPPPARGNARAETEEARIADILQSALVKHGGDVNRCFEKALADTLDVSGKIELAVDVGEGGRVTKAAPASDGVKSPVLLACLTESAATWTLAGIDPGSTVIVPLAFEGQAAQFSVQVKDAPDHGPPAPPSKKAGSPAPVPPFSVKLLVDEATMRAQKAALTQLTIGPANRIAMHKHPGNEVLYVLKGHARVLGPTGHGPEKLDEGMAILIPAGMPHAIENMGRTSSAVLLDVFAPMGPERVYRDQKDPAGRAAVGVRWEGEDQAAPRSGEDGRQRSLRGHPRGRTGRRGSAQLAPRLGGDPVRGVGRGQRDDRQREADLRRRGGAAHPRRPAARGEIHRPREDGHGTGLRARRPRGALPRRTGGRREAQDQVTTTR